MIVQSRDPVLLFGGSHVSRTDVEDALIHAKQAVAADGGARHAAEYGVELTAIIGDMDSISPENAATFAQKLHKVAEQETTDFDKALRQISAPLVIGLGFSGGRFDHALAAMHVLLRHPDRPCLLVGGETITVLAPPVITVPVEAGTDVSLFPFAPCSCTSEGLEWPTEGLAFDPLSQIGTSNIANGPITLSVNQPAMMLILPRTALDTTVTALLSAGRWPAPVR